MTNHCIDDLFAVRAKQVPPQIYGPEHRSGQIPLISFSYGLADPELFPRDDLLAATSEVLGEDDAAALNYGPSYSGLRDQIVARMRGRGVAAEAPNILVCYGSSQILALLPQIFIDPGDVVLIEGPSFLGAVRLFARAGAQLISVPVDEHGMDVDALHTIVRDLHSRNIRPKFVYTIPTFQNPTGATLSLARRRQLVEVAATYGIIIVEDDAYGDLRFEGEAIPPLAALDTAGWVIYVGTFSKILAPGLRMGWACAHPSIIERLATFKSEGTAGPFLTRLVACYCADGRLDAHIQRLNEHYQRKRDVMLDTIARAFPSDARPLRAEGGFFVWCKLPAGMRATQLLPVAEERGVTFLPGTRCFADEQGDDAIRLAFSFQPIEQITEGITHLGEAMRAL